MENRELRMRKRGSALLIVLGFLSFMVVSAISFSIYMRSERAPSSALRQGVATRFLVKAAVAQAMSRVDDAVRNNPFPGLVYENAPNNQKYKTNRNAVYDYWESRVFMPPNNPKVVNGVTEDGTTATQDSQLETRFAPHSETVSVLNLEALGYLPPDLVNDVRFLSRSSWAAKWNYFNYDAGRFAYCAVNVSDYFDVTKMKAFAARNSSYDGRITLSNFFTDNNYHFNEGDAKNFDTFVSSPSSLSDVSFTSMMDYNLACWAKYSQGSVFSPFGWWIDGNGGKSYFYQTTVKPLEGDHSSIITRVKRQPFIIGSISANEAAAGINSGSSGSGSATETSGGYLNLLNRESQPFDEAIVEDNSATISRVYDQANNPSRNFWDEEVLRYLSMAREGIFTSFMLYDYLDRNDIPLSLAMPCVERVPSIAALNLEPANLTVGLEPQSPITTGGSAGAPKVTTTDYNLKFPINQIAMNAVINYPFQTTLAEKFFTKGDFKLEYVVKTFLVLDANQAPSIPKCRITSGGDILKQANRSVFEVTTGNDFLDNNFVLISQTMTAKQLSYEDVTNPNTPISVQLMLGNSANGKKILSVVETQNVDQEGNEVGDPTKEYKFEVFPLSFNDGVLTPRSDLATVKAENFGQVANLHCKLYFAVWARITAFGGDKVVDLVPATVEDDLSNNVNNDEPRAQMLFGSSKSGGTPVMVFEAQSQQPVKLGDWIGQSPQQGTPLIISQGGQYSTMYTVDPRYNHAPENWFYSTDTNIKYSDWVSKGPGSAGLTAEAADQIVNQTVSNQGYLQSLAELTALPRILSTQPNDLIVNFNGTPRIQASDIANINFIKGGNINLWELYIGNSDKDVYPKYLVNPYTDNDEIFKSVLAFTPYDWWVAGTNYNATSYSSESSLKNNNVSQNIKYTYSNEGNTELDLGCEELRYITQVAPLMRKYIRNQYIKNGKTWEVAYDEFCHAWFGVPEMRRGRNVVTDSSTAYVTTLGVDTFPIGSNNNQLLTAFDPRYDSLVNLLSDQTDVGDVITKAENIAAALSSTEKKFLYSFWRSCFGDADRQLFLIFVRAESNALGGTGSGTPAQLGGRAVALVWRDPDPLPGSIDEDQEDSQLIYDERRQPHRMRILFYHQFE